MKLAGAILGLLCLAAEPLAAQETVLPRLGTNIGWSFVYACPSADTTCSVYVEYAAVPAYAYTDREGRRTPFAAWVRDQALPAMRGSGLNFIRHFFSPGTDLACQGCGYSGAPIGNRPFLLPRGSPYVSGLSFATRSQPGLEPWVFDNLKMFFQDLAAAGLEVDFTLHWDENYGYWASTAGEGGFVGYPALRETWLNAAAALVASGAGVLQIEPSQEQQMFQTSIEHHPVALDFTPGMIQSRVIAPGDWGEKPKAVYGVEFLDATLGPLQSRFPGLAGRIFPGLEARGGAAGACNAETYNGWGDGPWTTTDLQSYYNYVASRGLAFPWTINVHRYVGLDLNSNPGETVSEVRQSFDDVYAFHSGNVEAAATRCPGKWTSPAPFIQAPYVVFGETNSDAVITWDALRTVTEGYTLSRLSQWTGGAYRQTILMPWFFGHGANPWDPENAAANIKK